MSTLKYRSLLVGLILGASVAICQGQTDYDDFDYEGNTNVGSKILADREGNIYVAGTGLSDSHGNDFVLLKYRLDAEGDAFVLQWSVFYDGPGNGEDVVTGLVLSKDGIPYVSGYSQGSGTGYDFAVKAFNPADGTRIWPASGGIFHNGAARYNTSGSQNDFARDMAIDVSGNLLICGDYLVSSRSYGLTIVFEPDGDIKSGWPEVYGSSTKNVYLNGIATDAANRVAVCGKVQVDEDDSNMLFLLYTGGSTLTVEEAYDYGGFHDIAYDVTYTELARFAVAGSVQPFSNDDRFAVALFRYNNDPARVWTKVYATTDSESVAVTYGDGFVYATGRVGNSFLTVKLEEGDGDYSTTWATDGTHGAGVRVFDSNPSNSTAKDIWLAGTNVYITGNGNTAGAAPRLLHT